MSYLSDVARLQSGLFPQAAFACLAGGSLSCVPEQSPREWTSGVCDGLDGAEARKLAVMSALEEQVGPVWLGMDTQPGPRRTFLYMLAAYAAGVDVADALADMNAWALSRLHGRGVEDPCGLLDAGTMKAGHAVIEEARLRHRHATGVILAVIARAKVVGVVPNAHYLWIKPCDPVCWRLLDGHGRRTHRILCLGAMSHYMAECTMAGPLDEIHMEPAAASLLAMPGL